MIDFSDFVSVEWELQIVSSNYADISAECGDSDVCTGPGGAKRVGYEVAVFDSLSKFFLVGITSGGVLLDTTGQYCEATSPLIPFDTTDGFHHYLLIISGGVGRLYIDGKLITQQSVGTNMNVNPNRISFGDGSHYGESYTHLKRFRYTFAAEKVPAISVWGMTTLILSLITAAVLIIRRRQNFGIRT